jgi:lysophospholipase L1-like esterase
VEKSNESGAPEIAWHRPDRPPFVVSGFAWFDAARPRYRRLPIVPVGTIPAAVDHLADSTAGGQVSFSTDSKVVAIRAQLSGPATMYHMPATGQCGFDLYISTSGALRYHKTGAFELFHAWKYRSDLFVSDRSEVQSYTINFPLYQGVEELEIGLEADSRIESPPPQKRSGRIVAYGTSITQGGCASRPGMAYTNLLSRRLGIEFINLGFSGSGKGEPEVVRLVASVEDARCFILDYEANTGGIDGLSRTLPGAVSIIRERYPLAPVLLISRIPFARDLTDAASARERLLSVDMQRRFIASRIEAGDRNIHFLDGGTLLGDDFEECTVDGVHPTDLGFLRMASGIEPVLTRLLDNGNR